MSPCLLYLRSASIATTLKALTGLPVAQGLPGEVASVGAGEVADPVPVPSPGSGVLSVAAGLLSGSGRSEGTLSARALRRPQAPP